MLIPEQNLPSFRSCERIYTPIFLGALMNATKNTPPIQIINKGKWINADRLRWCRLFGIPMQDETPADFPRDAAAARVLISGPYFTAAADTIELHGGIGFTWEHDAHLYYKNALSGKVLLGGPGEQLDRLASELGM